MNKFPPWLALAVLVCLGCSGESNKDKAKARGPAGSRETADVDASELGNVHQDPLPAKDAPRKPKAAAKDGEADKVARKIVYTATLSLIVEDLNKAESALLELIDKEKALIARSAITGTTGSPRKGTWTLRVPVERMRPFLQAVLKMGVPEINTTDSEDVTGRYYDLEASLKNYKADEESTRKQLAETSKEESRKVLRDELRELRTRIEQMEGEYKRLVNLTSLTTVNLTFREIKNYVPPSTPPPPSFGSNIRTTFADSVGVLVEFGKWVVLMGTAIVPWLPLLAVVGILGWVVLRRRKQPRPA